MDFNKALGKAISGLRKSKNITQESISGFASRSYLSEVENGKKEVSVVKINEYAASIEVHPLTILTQAYLNLNPAIDIDNLQSLIKSELSFDTGLKKL
ncbi:helix-turn-helix domain-containing protein [Methylophilus luteus]|uniref:Helix-turn-helix domain-containing protein n=1 Tax=Methylophilus luteus TaxID=640108 RepID=A0ABW3FAS1_9PROT